MDAASPSGSGGDSDADAHPRVHPSAAPPEPPALHGFGCAFARGRCGHDELFRPHYTRTNLRKGDKILRCFPHCCPDHVSRSFCGASLHVDVHWDGAVASAVDVLVFARFRVQDARGRVPGDHVTLAEIAQSLQSESNPHGEWIAAASVATASSAGSREWVFELNHEARWYYHWESGVAKRHRLKHHVLEVYVLSPSFSALSSSAGATAGDHRPLQVVALTRSPPFRLISFRRATPKAVQALSVPRVQRAAGAKSDATAPDNSNRSPSVSVTRRPREATTREVDDDEEEEKTSQVAEARARPPPALPQPPMRRQRMDHHPYPQPLPHPQHQAYTHPTTTTTAFTRSSLETPFHAPSPTTGRPSFADLTSFLHRAPQQRAAPASIAPPVPLATHRRAAMASQRLLRLLRGLRLVSSAATIQYMDTFQRVYDEALARASGSARSSSTQPSTPLSPVDAVHRLLADAGVLHAGHFRLPTELTAILCELLLWLSFDVDLHRAVHALVVRDATAVFSQARLQPVFAALIEWLERHVDAFLHDRGWRLEDIVRETDAANATGYVLPHQDDEFASALRLCVAQFSEHCATQAQSSASAARRRRQISRGVSVATPLAQWALNGDWKCEMLRGGVSVRSLNASAPEDLSLPTLFAMLRELGAIRLRLDGASPATATLDVCSLLNPALSSGEPLTGARLTLDGTGHWFRSLPSGLSTATLAPGELQWGDHSGDVAWASGAVRCQIYAWGSRDPSSLGRCFELQLWTPTAATLAVRVVSSRAALDPAEVARLCGGAHASADAVTRALAFCSLTQKLRLVRAWEPMLEAELQYARVPQR